MFYRDTWVEIDLDRIYHNVSRIKAHARFETLFAVVKSNAYGHGDIEVARTALEAGATHLAVAILDEALKLRRHFPQTPILTMGPIRIDDLAVAAEHRITLTAHDLDWIDRATAYAGPRLDIHLKLDTGMHRIGINDPKQLRLACERLRANPAFNLCGLFSHFATADSDAAYYQQQLQCFEQLTAALDLSSFEQVHQSNSAAMLVHGKQPLSNGGRLGIAMYGLTPGADLVLPLPLQQAFSLHSRITQVKRLRPGDQVSYGGTYVADTEQWIGTLPLGYADGWLRQHQDRDVEIQGKRYPIVGRICMDQCMVRIDASIPVGTQVTLLGDLINITEAANDLQTINYEIVCTISDRVPRIYKRHGQQIGERNDRFTELPAGL
ncbi:MAG: alanine racemase [Motiliproteus sp.]|jgi:alanine racemase